MRLQVREALSLVMWKFSYMISETRVSVLPAEPSLTLPPHTHWLKNHQPLFPCNQKSSVQVLQFYVYSIVDQWPDLPSQYLSRINCLKDFTLVGFHETLLWANISFECETWRESVIDKLILIYFFFFKVYPSWDALYPWLECMHLCSWSMFW